MWETLSGQRSSIAPTLGASEPGGGGLDQTASSWPGSDGVRAPVNGGLSQPAVQPKLSHALHFHGDNAAMVLICHSGRNPSMRHMGRTHGISLTLIHGEVAVTKRTKMGYISTERMAADIFHETFPRS